MVIFTWIFLGVSALLILFSAACYGIFIAADSPDWKKLATKTFRIAAVIVLFYMNVYIYVNVVRAARGDKPDAPAVETEE